MARKSKKMKGGNIGGADENVSFTINIKLVLFVIAALVIGFCLAYLYMNKTRKTTIIDRTECNPSNLLPIFNIS